MTNRSHLIRKLVSDKKGFTRTVYVRPEQPTGSFQLSSLRPRHDEQEFPGFHWEEARNPRIATLVKKQKRGPEKLEASFVIVVSNRAAEVILGAPEELEAEEVYMRGGCLTFAYAAAMLTDKPIAIFSQADSERKDGDAWAGHATLEVSPGEYLDITGSGRAKDVKSYFGTPMGDPITFDSPAQAQKYVSSRGFEDDDISDYLFEHTGELEWLVTLDFVRHTLESEGISFEMKRLEELEARYPKSKPSTRSAAS